MFNIIIYKLKKKFKNYKYIKFSKKNYFLCKTISYGLTQK